MPKLVGASRAHERSNPTRTGTFTSRKQWVLFLGILLATLAVIATRRLDALTRAQFYAEDGLVWYAQAYHLGPWHALLLPRDGYLQTLPRLVAALSLLSPLRWAPLLMNVVGLLIQALPVPILLSSRMRNWGPLQLRIALALTYIALPNAGELHASITEAHWHLALAACLLTLAEPPAVREAWLVDLAILLLCGLSGPFVLPLSFIAIVNWWARRGRWRLSVACVLSVCAALQTGCLLLSRSRPQGQLGANLHRFLEILSAQVYAGSLLGRNAFHRRGDFVLVLVAVLGTSLLFYCFLKAGLEWRLFLLFCAAVFAGSVANPNAGRGPSQWAALSGVWDARYWFFPMLAFVWSLVWIALQASAVVPRIIASACLALMLAYLPKNWLLKPEDDVHFQSAARRFEQARPGETVTIPVLPPGWTMELQKRY